MCRARSREAAWAVLTAVALACLGCMDLQLPESLEIPFPGEKAVLAAIDTGPPSWANTTWTVYHVVPEDSWSCHGPGQAGELKLLGRIEFGTRGEVLAITEYQGCGHEMMGPLLIPDGQLHPLAEPGTTYVGESYGEEIGNEIGFTAHAKAFMGPVKAATASFYAYGTVNESGDQFDGIFGFEVDSEPMPSPDGMCQPDPYICEVAVVALIER